MKLRNTIKNQKLCKINITRQKNYSSNKDLLSFNNERNFYSLLKCLKRMARELLTSGQTKLTLSISLTIP